LRCGWEQAGNPDFSGLPQQAPTIMPSEGV
jgi:hypothetical protein